jgi:hypothetical protein
MFSESSDRGIMPGQQIIDLPLDAEVDLEEAAYRRTMDRVIGADRSGSMVVSAFNSSI